MILPARPPFAGAALLAFLAKRAVPGVEEVTAHGYRRSLRLAHAPGVAELEPARDGMRVTLHTDARDRDEALTQLHALLDLDAPVAEIDATLRDDPHLQPYRPGLRVPGTVDAGEIAVRAVLGQQITVVAARTHAGRLVQVAGEPLAEPSGSITHRFPTLEAIAEAPDDAFAMPRTRRETLRSLAGQPLDRLHELRGIGPWTQTYVNMRALRDRDAWLPTDIGVRHGLERLGVAVDPDRWRPYRSYAVLSLWTN